MFSYKNIQSISGIKIKNHRPKSMHIAILIPTYNESTNISELLPRIAASVKIHTATKFSAIIIDDSSPDGTADMAREVGRQCSKDNLKTIVLTRENKDGLGRAYLHAFNYVLNSSSNYEFIIQMDADLSHKPEYISDFISAAEKGADFVVGSRYVKYGGVSNWSWHRRVISKAGNLYAKFMLGAEINDYTGGFNLYSTDLLRKIKFADLHTNGYGFLISLKYSMIEKNAAIVEVPIMFIDREFGKSKMPLNTFFDSFILVLRLWSKRVRNRLIN